MIESPTILCVLEQDTWRTQQMSQPLGRTNPLDLFLTRDAQLGGEVMRHLFYAGLSHRGGVMRVPLSAMFIIAAGTATAVLSAACGGDDAVGPPPDPPPMLTTINGYVRSFVDSTPVPGLRVTACEEYTYYDQSQGKLVTTVKELKSATSQPDGAYQLFFRASCRILSHVYLTVRAVPSPTHMVRDVTPEGSIGLVCKVPDIQADLWVGPSPVGLPRSCPWE